ncbi:peptidylprolyl isomerase [Flavobacterium chuncheonense]|uniref:Periplasmic chaperone PpiD n=1 Tax=Flavobacterium chuncheonense TaxID=2026653 RepID=A0ABW5YMY4_9FLAO
MAVLSKIRQRSFILIVIIALALFSFVLADVIKSGGFGTNSNNVGTVDGTDIDGQAFMRKVAQLEKQNQNTTSTQAINSVWEQEVRGVVIGNEIEKLGLGIGNEQLINVIKTNPYFAQNPQFLNEAGMFDEAKFREFVLSIKNDPNQDRWVEWQNFEKEAEKAAVEQMYYNMVKGGVYTTKAEGEFKHLLENKKVTFQYVTVPYNTVNDEEVKVSDDEIIAYMKNNAKKYKSENTTSIDYVLLENKPSKEDEAEMAKKINRLMFGQVVYNETTKTNDTLPSFREIKNVGEFVNENSDIKFDSTYVAKKDLPLEFQEQLFNLSKGEVFGPYVFNGHQCISRMLDRKPNSSAKASHILIGFAGAERSTATRTKEEAKTLANDLLAKAKANPSSFVTLANENSEDPGSKSNGGEYDNITPGQMVPTFNDFVFDSPVGAIGVVETAFGFHVIKVSAKYDAVLLGTVAQSIQPSEATIDAIYTKASKIEADANGKDFAEVAKAAAVEVIPATNIKSSDENIGSLGNEREIVRWTHNEDTNIGDVKRFETPQGFVIAKLKSRNESGLLSLDIARQSVGGILKNEKKSEILKKKMTGATLADVAKTSGGSVITASNIALGTPNIPNIGNEPKVVGKAFNLEANKTSGVIEGNSGIFMVQKTAVVEAPKTNSYASYISQEKTQQQNAAQSRAYQALKEKATIEDNRAKL